MFGPYSLRGEAELGKGNKLRLNVLQPLDLSSLLTEESVSAVDAAGCELCFGKRLTMLFPGSVSGRVPPDPQSLSSIELLIRLERCVVPNTAISLVPSFAFDTLQQDIPLFVSVLMTVPFPFEGIAFSVFTAETPTLFSVFRSTEIVLPLLVERSGADGET